MELSAKGFSTSALDLRSVVFVIFSLRFRVEEVFSSDRKKRRNFIIPRRSKVPRVKLPALEKIFVSPSARRGIYSGVA